MTTWSDIIGPLKQQAYFIQAYNFQQNLRDQGTEVYPPRGDIFNAFKYTPFDKLKAVILGQDPYHEPGQAMGLSFSVPVGITQPPSLKNIFKELEHEYPGRFQRPSHGNLIPWARQGVLLLNTTLTVTRGQAYSHAGQGWELFTDEVIKAVSAHKDNVVFMLWGAPARKKAELIDKNRHCVLECAHPSPRSAIHGFLGCNHFVQCNAYLKEHGLREVDWRLPLQLQGDEEL